MTDRYVVVADLKSQDKRQDALRITAPYNPEITDGRFVIRTTSMYDAYRIQSALRYEDSHRRFMHHVFFPIAVYLEEKFDLGRKK